MRTAIDIVERKRARWSSVREEANRKRDEWMPDMRSRSIGDFLQGVASSSATPGGGSVAALSGAIAADLGCMVCRLAMNKKPSDDLANLLQCFTSLEGNFLDLAERDELAFSAVMDAYRIDRADDRRPAMIAKALLDATNVPQRVAKKGIELLEHLCALVPLGSKQSVSDVGVAAHLAEASVKSALLNVRINLAYMHDEVEIKRIEAVANELEKMCFDVSARAISFVRARTTQ